MDPVWVGIIVGATFTVICVAYIIYAFCPREELQPASSHTITYA